MIKNHTYKAWHVLVSFLLGAVLIAGVLLVPSYGGEGFSRLGKGKSPMDSKGKGCASMDLCDIDAKLNLILSELGYFTKSFTQFTASWTQYTAQAKKVQTMINEIYSRK